MSLAANLDRLGTELRANRRLQVGVALIALLVLAWLWLVLADGHAALVRERLATEERIERMQQVAGQDFWPARAADAVALRDALVAEIPQADSPGLAQAAFQSWLGRQLESLAGQPQVAMEEPLELEAFPGIVRTSATLSGSLPTRQVVELLRRIEADRQLIVVPAIQIRSENNETISLTVHAFYRVGTPLSAEDSP